MFKALSFLGLFLGEPSSPDSSLLSLADIDVSTFKLARIPKIFMSSYYEHNTTRPFFSKNKFPVNSLVVFICFS